MNEQTTIAPIIVKPTAIISLAPISIPAPQRGIDLGVRISAPVDGINLPVILFSHGFGMSMDSYAPLANYWASQGFVVIQPTHLDSATLGLQPTDPRTPVIWRYREQDLLLLLDNLPRLKAAVPALKGRLDLDRIAVAGHSWGATTVSQLLGARHPDPTTGATVSLTDSRVKAGVLEQDRDELNRGGIRKSVWL